MPDIPRDLQAEVSVSGVVVHGPRDRSLASMVVMGGLVSAGIGFGLVGPAVIGGAIATFGVAVGALSLMKRRRAESLQVNERWITLRRTHALGRVTQIRFALDDLERLGVVPPKNGLYDASLYLRSGDLKIKFGEGLSESALQWTHDIIEEARLVSERRVLAEGRRYNFEKVAPAEIVSLTQR